MGPLHTKTMLAKFGIFMTLYISLTLSELKNSCETLYSEIHLVKEEYTKGKELVRTCEDDIDVSKCDGYCVSTTTPSARIATAVEKVATPKEQSHLKGVLIKMGTRSRQ